MSRLLGFGPIPTDRPIDGSHRLTVRQPSVVMVGAFLDLIFLAVAFGVLNDPGKTVGSGNGFIDRWFFGVLVVPAMWGIDRFLLRPRIRVDDSGVRFENPMQTIEAKWPAVLGAGYDTALRLSLADGDMVASVVFGKALSSPLTQRSRVDELAEVINVESSRRVGRTYEKDATYAAELLIGSIDGPPAPRPSGPGASLRQSWGLVNLAAYALTWTVACLIGAAVS